MGLMKSHALSAGILGKGSLTCDDLVDELPLLRHDRCACFLRAGKAGRLGCLAGSLGTPPSEDPAERSAAARVSNVHRGGGRGALSSGARFGYRARSAFERRSLRLFSVPLQKQQVPAHLKTASPAAPTLICAVSEDAQKDSKSWLFTFCRF